MAAGNSINLNTTGIVGFSLFSFTATPVTQYNVLTGGATSGTLNNVAPSATSGVPLISQGSSAHPIFGTAVVAGGGTGNTTFTAYSVICAGTTSTGAFQNVSGLGSSTNVLKSNGASALPTWQAASGGGGAAAFSLMSSSGSDPVDATTYYLSYQQIVNNTASAMITRCYMPKAGTINKVYGNLNVAGTLGTTENATLALRLNDTTNTNITTTLQFNAVNATFNNTSLGLSVSAGDFIDVVLICPTWSTNPTTVKIALTYLLS